MEYDPADVIALIAPIEQGVADVVYGSRLSGGAPQRAYMFWHLIGNRFLSLLTGVLFNTTLSDMETGYKAFRSEVLASLRLTRDDFGIEPEITGEICRRRLRIYEMPIAYYGRTYAEGKNITWRDGLTALGAVRRAVAGAVGRDHAARRAAAAGGRRPRGHRRLHVPRGCAASSSTTRSRRCATATSSGSSRRCRSSRSAIVLRGVRWWALYDDEQRPPLRAVMYALLVGYFFNNILPARAGEAARVIALHNRARTPRAEIVGTVVVERVFDLLALLLILLCAYPWLPEISWLRNAAILGAIVDAIVLAVLIVLIVRYDARAVHWLLSPLRRIRAPASPSASRRRRSTRPAASSPCATRSSPLRGFALTIASWVVLGDLLLDPHGRLPPRPAARPPAILVTVAINLSLVLPSSPAALGVFEAATIIALNAFDVPHAEALSYALVLHLLNLVPFLVIGAVLLGPAALRRNR